MSETFITVTLEDDEGYEVEYHLPANWAVCHRCRGNGKHVNPNVDYGGISVQEFHEDPDFADDYFSGVYDVTCYECNGRTTVKEVDWKELEKKDPELKKMYEEYLRDEADYQAMVAAERRMGA